MWYDELYSINMAAMPLKYMIITCTSDVHPLFYYLLVNIFAKLFSFISLEHVGVILSLIPFYLLIGLGLTKVRKNFGLLTAGLFCLCIVSMPQLLRFSVEVRMYGWALLFITASYILIYEINKNPTTKNWILLTILTILSAYTHYFSAVASFSLYLVFLAYSIYKKREHVKNIIISAVISVLAYIPWIPSLINQIHRVQNGYWIEPITAKTIISYLYYLFSPFNSYIDGNAIIKPDLVGTILIIAFVIAIVYYLKNKNEKIGSYPLLGLIAALLVPIIGVGVSLAYSPIFFMRYLIPILGIVYLSFSILVDNIKENKKIFITIIVIILAVSLINMICFANNEKANYDSETEMKEAFYSTIPTGSIIIFDGFNSYLTSHILDNNYTAIYLENYEAPYKSEHQWRSNSSSCLEEILEKNNLTHYNKSIYIVDVNNKYPELANAGYNIKLINTYNYINFYQLNVDKN